MDYISTRGSAPHLTIDRATQRGLAVDGGLYVPQEWPHLDLDPLYQAYKTSTQERPNQAHLALRLSVLNALYSAFSGARGWSTEEVKRLSERVATVPTTLRSLSSTLSILELYHGPTAAFKDVGAAGLATALSLRAQRSYTVLVATSGDTGAAVAAAFWRDPLARVVLLFPKGRVSSLQRAQLTRFGENVCSLEVAGSFDDCQALVKSAFLDQGLSQRANLTSANSINIGRLIPQMSYYLTAAIEYKHQHKEGVLPRFMIPSGNLGNVTAALWARLCAPQWFGDLSISTNANDVIPQAFQHGVYTPRPSQHTLANAMDVGSPSNWERLTYTFGDLFGVRSKLSAYATQDQEIEAAMRLALTQEGVIICPHTATAYHHAKRLGGSWIIVATAHPAKFPLVTQHAVNISCPPPVMLQEILDRREDVHQISADFSQVRSWLDELA